jgi:hypothetical protein
MRGRPSGLDESIGDSNQVEWIRSLREQIRGPVVEIGARHYAPESSMDYRGICEGLEFLGVDISAAANVDVVVDVTEDFAVVDRALGGRRFHTVICCSVLEHVPNVFKMAANMTQLTAPGGVLFLSVPFTWRYHGYPKDYWRFTPEAIEYLFPEFAFDKGLSSLSSNVAGHVRPFDRNPNEFLVQPTPGGVNPYLLLPGLINMFGVKKL